MNNINWTVRFKNPLWWAEIAMAVMLPILTYMGMQWEDVTSWGKLAQVLAQAVQNPVIVVSVAVAVYNAVTDPTTRGVGDSAQAMTYTEPKEG